MFLYQTISPGTLFLIIWRTVLYYGLHLWVYLAPGHYPNVSSRNMEKKLSPIIKHITHRVCSAAFLRDSTQAWTFSIFLYPTTGEKMKFFFTPWRNILENIGKPWPIWKIGLSPLRVDFRFLKEASRLKYINLVFSKLRKKISPR